MDPSIVLQQAGTMANAAEETCAVNSHPELNLNCSMFTVWIQNSAVNGAYASVNWQLYALVHES